MAVACAVQNLHIMAQSLGIAGMWHSKGQFGCILAVAAGLGLQRARPIARLFYVWLA